VINIYNDQNGPIESLHIWRLDQNYFRLDVAYEETPRSLATWQEETHAAIVLNGGYYSAENEKYFPDGLTIVDGEAFGRSFNGFGGMLAINEHRAELRWLVEEPYDPAEQFQAALQSFPISSGLAACLIGAERKIVGARIIGRIGPVDPFHRCSDTLP
jgi:hypothetical protein